MLVVHTAVESSEQQCTQYLKSNIKTMADPWLHDFCARYGIPIADEHILMELNLTDLKKLIAFDKCSLSAQNSLVSFATKTEANATYNTLLAPQTDLTLIAEIINTETNFHYTSRPPTAPLLPPNHEVFITDLNGNYYEDPQSQPVPETIPEILPIDFNFESYTLPMTTLNCSTDNYSDDQGDTYEIDKALMKELMDDSFEFLFMDSIQPPNEKNSNVMSQAVNIDVAGQMVEKSLPQRNDEAENEFKKRVETITRRNLPAKKRNKAFLEIVRDFREKMPDRMLRCKICNTISKRADHLKTHLARHAGLRLYPCTMCPASFTRQDEKTRHEKKYCSKKGKKAVRNCRSHG